MKVEIANRQLLIHLDTDADQDAYNRWLVEAWRIMPRLSLLAREEPLALGWLEFTSKQRDEGLWAIPLFSAFFESERAMSLALINRSQKNMSRDAQDGQKVRDIWRKALAGLRLLCFVPYDEVLEMEKDWRTHEYLSRVRDKNVARITQREKYRALRNANMCVTRAWDSVAEFFVRNPQFVAQWVLLHGLARLSENPETKKTN